jgi:hypothetical protein
VIEELTLGMILKFIYRRLQISSDGFPVDIGQTSAGPAAISAHSLVLVLVLSHIIDSKTPFAIPNVSPKIRNRNSR